MSPAASVHRVVEMVYLSLGLIGCDVNVRVGKVLVSAGSVGRAVGLEVFGCASDEANC